MQVGIRVRTNYLDAIERYNAYLVAKGFYQLEDHDYYETFTSVVKSGTIGIILILEALHHWVLR